MFYEEKFIDGSLMFRITPHSKWTPKLTSVGVTQTK